MNETPDLLTIEFPAKSRFLSLARLNAASIAGAGGFDIEELDDIRLAVGEAIGWLLRDEAAGGIITVTYQADGGEFCLQAKRVAEALPRCEPDDLVDAILAAILDSHELGTRADGERWVELRKERVVVER